MLAVPILKVRPHRPHLPYEEPLCCANCSQRLARIPWPNLHQGVESFFCSFVFTIFASLVTAGSPSLLMTIFVRHNLSNHFAIEATMNPSLGLFVGTLTAWIVPVCSSTAVRAVLWGLRGLDLQAFCAEKLEIELHHRRPFGIHIMWLRLVWCRHSFSHLTDCTPPCCR